MKFHKDDIIICRTKQEFVDTAKYLVKNGCTVANFDGDRFTETPWSVMEWVGLLAWSNNTWIRTSNIKSNNVINCQVVLRKEKLIKLR